MPNAAVRLVSKLNPVLQTAETKIARQPVLSRAGTKVSRTLHNGILRGGEPTRQTADFFHGTWLGHSLHAVLTDLTVGAWAMGMIFDWMGQASGKADWQKTGDVLTQAGVISALPTAIAGVTDYSAIEQDASSTGALHALVNTLGLGLYIGSWIARRKGRRGLALSLSSTAFGGLLFSSWLGGELVYGLGIGVDHADRFKSTPDWTPILRTSELEEGKTRCATYQGKKVLLYREGSEVFAIGAVCSHAGGPLEEGSFQNGQVQCPWHQSVFSLKDGFVVHGPATKSQQRFETRIEGDQIQVRPLPLERNAERKAQGGAQAA